MNVVDSSAWLEYFSGGPNSGRFAGAIEDIPRLVVPTIVI
jgi:toxin FitB